jgi:hypothetical protein
MITVAVFYALILAWTHKVENHTTHVSPYILNFRHGSPFVGMIGFGDLKRGREDGGYPIA